MGEGCVFCDKRKPGNEKRASLELHGKPFYNVEHEEQLKESKNIGISMELSPSFIQWKNLH